MGFVEQVLAVARNTLLESVRQPVALVVVLIGTLLVIMSNPFAAYTMDDDNRMFVDIGLSTVFMSGAILSALLATSVLSREIENKTVLTVVSKSVPRFAFLLGKYLGVAGALTVCTAFLGVAFALVEMHGVLQTAATPMHWPVISLGLMAVLGALGAGIWCNYFYGMAFPAVFLVLGVPLLGIAYGLALMFGPDFAAQAPAKEFEGELWKAILLVLAGVLAMASVAVAASTRFGQVLTVATTLGMLLLGLLSDWIIGREVAELERLAQAGSVAVNSASLWCWKAAYAAVPNFQVFWTVDALNQGKSIPGSYIGWALAYGALVTTAALGVGTALFQRREVG